MLQEGSHHSSERARERLERYDLALRSIELVFGYRRRHYAALREGHGPIGGFDQNLEILQQLVVLAMHALREAL